ncbi:MAG TPA: trigger factor [Solirubrobacteraceae bacterium]|jgi:trigger factor|nr:trigger factor [Solirubrobacteraceae bacterium]
MATATAVSTTVTELPESRVRVEVVVPGEEVERRIEQQARALGRGMRIPGFRKGKVPAPLVMQRIGRAAVLDEAVREALPGWYAQAIDAAGVEVVGDPDLELGDLPAAAGDSLSFTIEVGVQPIATLGEYKGLEVGKREPEAGEEAITREIDAIRERMAKLESVEEPAAADDFVVIDYVGSIDGVPFEGGDGRDQPVQLASGRLIEGFEAGLIGAHAGEERTLEITFPVDYANEALAGQPAQFAVTVKDVKRKRLPELDEDFAADAGFDDMDELREDIAKRLREADEQRAQGEFREAALDAAVAGATIDVPEALARAHAAEMWERTLHSLSHQGVSKETYLQISGKTEEEVLAEAVPEADRTLRREAVIAALIEAEQIDPSDEDVLEALTPAAEREGVSSQELLETLRKNERLEQARRDLAAQKAVDLLVEQAKPISVEQARAREAIWTPDKEKDPGQPGSGQLWTPGS